MPGDGELRRVAARSRTQAPLSPRAPQLEYTAWIGGEGMPGVWGRRGEGGGLAAACCGSLSAAGGQGAPA